MVMTFKKPRIPLSLVVTGEAEVWLPALEKLIGPDYLRPHKVSSDHELLDVVGSGAADAAVLDEQAEWLLDALQMLRMIRRMNAALPVVVVTQRNDRRWLEDALQLAAFSVVARPLALEELLRQIQRLMVRIDRLCREE
ncbi:MAG: response regulator [Planctomycetaceae bacterium]|nr:response regulator [Planctomycetaceae bacterium]